MEWVADQNQKTPGEHALLYATRTAEGQEVTESACACSYYSSKQVQKTVLFASLFTLWGIFLVFFSVAAMYSFVSCSSGMPGFSVAAIWTDDAQQKTC